MVPHVEQLPAKLIIDDLRNEDLISRISEHAENGRSHRSVLGDFRAEDAAENAAVEKKRLRH